MISPLLIHLFIRVTADEGGQKIPTILASSNILSPTLLPPSHQSNSKFPTFLPNSSNSKQQLRAKDYK